jgi:DNA-binding MarR family transcriptional regulator
MVVGYLPPPLAGTGRLSIQRVLRRKNSSVSIEFVARQSAMTTNVPSARRAPAGGDIQQSELFFSFRVSIVAKLLDRRMARLVGDQFGLAVAEYRVMAQISIWPKSTVRAISERTFVDKAQVSRAVAVLEAQDLITRITPSSDRRSPVFTATRSGRALMNRITPLRRAQERELVNFLGRAKADALTDSLQGLIDWLTEPMADGVPEPTASQRRQAIRSDRVARSAARARS